METLTSVNGLKKDLSELGYIRLDEIERSEETIKFYTHEWNGKRDEKGRPFVPDALLDRLLNLTIEQAWTVLRDEGYHNQFEGGWKMIHDNQPFVGRALTVQYMPARPDIDNKLKAIAAAHGRIGASNIWPIDMLKERDVYVADGFGKIFNGTLIGDNLANSIFAKTKTGVVFNAGARDLEGMQKIKGFNAFVRGFDPTAIKEMMVSEINSPICIGHAVVVPGDVVLAKREGVLFIPAHLAHKVAITGEFILLRDKFGHEMLRNKVFSAGEIDVEWSEKIKSAFYIWLNHHEKELPMPRKELDEYMEFCSW